MFLNINALIGITPFSFLIFIVYGFLLTLITFALSIILVSSKNNLFIPSWFSNFLISALYFLPFTFFCFPLYEMNIKLKTFPFDTSLVSTHNFETAYFYYCIILNIFNLLLQFLFLTQEFRRVFFNFQG